MPIAIYVLALAAFVVGTQSYVFSGLLADLAGDLDVAVGTAGQLLTAFAITSAVASPLVVSSLAHFKRKRVLIFSLIGVAAVNMVTALLPVFEGFLAARIVVAVVSAAVMPMAGAIGAGLVPTDRQGQALGIILSGLTIAFMVGVPIGTVVGSAFGWRATFVFSGLVSLAVIPAIAFLVPEAKATTEKTPVDWRVLRHHNVQLGLLLIGLSFIAAYPVITYLGPIITEITGVTGSSIGALQAFIGFGSVSGLVIGGLMADRRAFLSNMRVMYAVLAAVIAAWALVFAHTTPGTAVTIALVAAAIFLTAAALIAPSPAIEKALVQADPEQSAFTLAMNTSVIYLGQGIGAALGGVVIGALGYAMLGVIGGCVAAIGLIAAFLSRAKQPQL